MSDEEIGYLKAEVEALKIEAEALKTEASSRDYSTEEMRVAFLKTEEFKTC